MNTTKVEPPTTMSIDTTSINIMMLPPKTIAMITKANPPIRPNSVAKSTKHSSCYFSAFM
ncbi:MULTISPECIES: hypothetical protein [Vibrio]|uniref:hypothetical protein n=1 Tax=Vibrio sp. SCSIO 43135 TaxID=2819096 RepID=UPI0028C4210A|nr:hypothetical protein [Vibrio paucivorans]